MAVMTAAAAAGVMAEGAEAAGAEDAAAIVETATAAITAGGDGKVARVAQASEPPESAG